MTKSLAALLLAAALWSPPAHAAVAMPVAPAAKPADSALVTPVAEGCGWGRSRGPWGGCRGPGYAPGYAYAPQPWGGNGCPPGYWRGPWGHCRDTPYHGRLPGGGWR
jgi:hypothetical protein